MKKRKREGKRTSREILTNLLPNFNFDSGYDLPLSEGKLNGFIYFGTAKLLMPQIGHFISGSTIGKYSQIKSFVLGVPYPGSNLHKPTNMKI